MKSQLRQLGVFCAVAAAAASAALLFQPLGPEVRRVPAAFSPIQQPAGPPFDLSDLSIPADEVRGGGPPKDGIPALSNPKIVTAAKARTFLKDDERVVGVAIGRVARAYPISILTQHEIINDTVDGTPLAVTYCPLCDSVVVFDRRTPLGEKEFGVSGLLYNSNVLMYDRSEKESLWSQMLLAGVSGPAKNQPLTALPMELTTWATWRANHPSTEVISVDTGHTRDYQRNPYVSYFRQPGLMFPAQPVSDALPLKEPIIALWSSTSSIAVPAELFEEKTGRHKGVLDGMAYEIDFDAKTKNLRVLSADEGLSWANCYWFAWYAFHPATRIERK